MAKNTTQADYAFRVKEKYPEKGWQLLLEPRYENLPILKNGFITLELDSSVSKEKAEDLARNLSECVKVVCHTQL